MSVRSVERAGADAVRGDAFWPAQLAVLGALLLNLALPEKLTLGPTWLVPAVEGLLLLALVITTPRRTSNEGRGRRSAALAIIALVSIANTFSLVLLVHFLLKGGKANGHQLILSSIVIWLTNVIIFGLWYWELDRGGPGDRASGHDRPPDFLFPQMASPDVGPRDWRPNFVDYLYVSFTNATAFSPTDTMPLTPWTKVLMLVQSLASLITVALVAARAVNILS